MPNVSWEDIGGLENVKRELQEVISNLRSRVMCFFFCCAGNQVFCLFNLDYRLFNILWSIQRSLRSLACRPQRESYSMDHLDVERPYWPRQLLMSAKQTLLVLKDLSCLPCGLEKVRQMCEKYLIRLVDLLLVSCSLMNWTQLPLRYDL